MPDPIYLDYNATTPIDSVMLDAMLPYLQTHFGNPSSDHVYGYRTRATVVAARAQLATLLGVTPDAVIFTGGGAAQVVFAPDGMVTPFDIGVILADYL